MTDTDPPAAPDPAPGGAQDDALTRVLDDHQRWLRSERREGLRAELGLWIIWADAGTIEKSS